MHTPVNMYPDKYYYHAPVELPGGFCEVVQPLAEWVMRQLVAAYDDGYSTGRMDAARIEVMRHTSQSKS